MKMCNDRSKNLIQSPNEQFFSRPLILKKLPFICRIFSLNLPFVCKNRPIDQNFVLGIRERGFSLVELIVTLVVAAVLIVSVPSIRPMLQDGRLSTQANDLIGDLNYARSEAIKRRAFVGVCISTNGTSCAGGGNWRDGRAVFVGTGNNGTWQANDTILRFRGPLTSADTLTTTALADPIIFSANGASNLNIGATGFFTFCDDRGFTKGKMVNVNSMGQIAVSHRAPLACN